MPISKLLLQFTMILISTFVLTKTGAGPFLAFKFIVTKYILTLDLTHFSWQRHMNVGYDELQVKRFHACAQAPP